MAAAIMTVLKKRRKSWLTLTRTPEERAAMLRGADGPAYLKQAMLEKRGPRIGSAWNQRWVKLSNSQIEYGYYEESTNTPGATIDSIPIWQVQDVVPEKEFHSSELTGTTPNGNSGHHFDEHANGEIRSDGHANGEKLTHRSDVSIKSRSDTSDRDLIETLSDSAFCIVRRDVSEYNAEGHDENIGLKTRAYHFKASSESAMQEWINAILNARHVYIPERVTIFRQTRLKVKTVYEGTYFQIFVAFAIGVNFLCNAVEAEILPEEGSSEKQILDAFDIVFVWLFTLELAINMFSNLFMNFFSDAWNYFDTFVVLISLISSFSSDNSGLNVLRMVRAFRVFRLFRRLESLGQIIRAINQSLPAVGNALILVLIFTAIYAIMGTSLFQNQRPDKFGQFSISMYTMWSVMTFDDTGSLTNELMDIQEGPLIKVAVLSVGFILCNIVMAVLLDKFTEAAEASKTEVSKKEAEGSDLVLSTSMDPILEQFSRVDTESSLNMQMEEMFNFMDEDASATIFFHEFRDGLRRLETTPPIQFTAEDWNTHVISRGLAMTDGQLDIQTFKTLMSVHLKEYIHRKTAKAAGETNVQEKIRVIVRCLQQTAIVTYGSQQKVIQLDSNFVALSTKMQRLRTKIKAVNYRGIDIPSSSTLQSSSMGSKEIEGIESTVRTARKVPDNDLEVAQVVASANENGLTMNTPSTAMGREHTSHTTPTLESILGHPSTSTKLPSLDSSHFSSTDMEFVDIKSLKERVDVMQSRLTHTIEHAKSARKKTLSILSSRRSMEAGTMGQESGSDMETMIAKEGVGNIDASTLLDEKRDATPLSSNSRYSHLEKS